MIALGVIMVSTGCSQAARPHPTRPRAAPTVGPGAAR
jgi:hypothetical protein